MLMVSYSVALRETRPPLSSLLQQPICGSSWWVLLLLPRPVHPHLVSLLGPAAQPHSTQQPPLGHFPAGFVQLCWSPYIFPGTHQRLLCLTHLALALLSGLLVRSHPRVLLQSSAPQRAFLAALSTLALSHQSLSTTAGTVLIAPWWRFCSLRAGSSPSLPTGMGHSLRHKLSFTIIIEPPGQPGMGPDT